MSCCYVGAIFGFATGKSADVACRKNSPGKPCCESTLDCSNRSVLPATFTYLGRSIARSEWFEAPQANGNCCWSFAITRNDPWTTVCSIPASLIGMESILIGTYKRYAVSISIAIGSSQCTSQGAPVTQTIVSINNHYGYLRRNLLYDPPSLGCDVYGAQLQFTFPGFFPANPDYAGTWVQRRTKFYSSLSAATYTLTSSDRSTTCTGGCAGYYAIESGSVTLTTATTGQSITLGPDNTDWTFATT